MKSIFLSVLATVACFAAAETSIAQSCGCTSCPSGQCGAGGWGGLGYSAPTATQAYHESTFHNVIWPNQYVQPSRRGICQAFSIMVNNGWRRNNLLGAYHFEGDDQTELSEAGRRKTEWILTQAQPNRRSVFVERAGDLQRTAQRLQAVRNYAANLEPSAAGVDVQETYLRNEGHSAGAVDAVFTGFSANQMAPVLPESGGESSSGSTSDSGS